MRAWWRVRHPPPSAGQRLEFLWTAAVVAGIFGLLGYGTASAALGEVVTPASLAVFGPALALLLVLVTAQWGAYQGPVVFSVADVVHLLGAPLPRRGLAARRLVRALAWGAGAGALAAGAVITGLAGKGHGGVAADQAAGLAVGLAELGILAVAATWRVQRSPRLERVVRRATWPGALVAAALAAASEAGRVGRGIALWAGPWGWAVQPGAGVGRVGWLAGLVVLTLATVAAVAAAVRSCGDCSTERHLRRAEGRASAIASLTSLDARTARQALEAVGPRPAAGAAAGLGRLRSAIAAREPTALTRTLAIVWRDAVAAGRSPGRVVEAAALAASGTVLCLLDAERPAAVAAAMVLGYFGASRMLGPLRSELDVPARARLLLRPRLGRVLLTHTVVPVLVTVSASALAAVSCAIAGALPAHGAAAALAAVAVGPILTGCAAMSSRRGGRLPQTVLATAMAVDPSGGGVVTLMWLVAWPAAGAILGGVPTLLVARGGAGGALAAAGWTVIAGAVLAYLARRDPPDT